MAGGGGYNQLGGYGGGSGGNYSNGNQPALGGGQGNWMQSHPNANVFGSPGMIGGDAWKAAHPNYNVAGSPGWQAMHPPQQQQNQNWWTGGAPAQGWNPAGSGSNPPLQGQPDIADFFQHMFGGGGGYGNNYLY